MRNKIICSFILFIIPTIVFSQSLKFKIEQLKDSYKELKKDPDSRNKQLTYLGRFPSNASSFLKIFQPKDYKRLYSDSHDYINAFINLSGHYPKVVIDKSINIGKNLTWQADATGDMQRSIVILGSSNTRIFSNKVHSLTTSQINHLIKFLADVENFKAYSEYQILINSLNKTGEIRLANQFIKARSLREKEKDH